MAASYRGKYPGAVKARRWMDVVVLLPALWLAGLVLYAFAMRLSYPFDLEWMEGGMMVHAWRIAEWLPVYQEPDADWVPYIYPPGYPAVVAGLSPVFGLTMGLGRAVSVLSTLAACGALIFAGHRLQNAVLGCVAACLYLVCYPCSGAFYDLVRPDSLGLALFSWSVVLGLGGRRARDAAGLLLACAFMVKHNYAAYGIAMSIGIWRMHGWRQAVRFGLLAAVPALLFVIGMQIGTGGHFLTTLLGVAGAHPMVLTRFVPGGIEELGRHTAVLMVGLSWAFVALSARSWRPWALAGVLAVLFVAVGTQFTGSKNMPDPWWVTEWTIWATFGVATAGLFAPDLRDGRWIHGVGITLTAVLTAGLMRAHHGGFLNVWMPLHWVIALATLVAACGLRARFQRPVEGLVLLAVLGQLYVRSDFEPERYIPQPEDLAGGQSFVDALQDCEGPVLSPYAPWLPTYAGHEPSWHLIALWDIAHKDGPYRSSVKKVRDAIAEQRWDCVVTATGRKMGYGLADHYKPALLPAMPKPGPAWVGPRPFLPKSGWRVRPSRIQRPKDARPDPQR